MTIQSINPATGKCVKSFTAMTPTEIKGALQLSKTAFTHWQAQDMSVRQALMQALAGILTETAATAAHLMTTEMGKTLSAAHAEIEKCINYCSYLADMTPQYLADEHVKTEYKASYTRALPLGPILLIMPWNFPLWQVIRVAVPAIMAGNTVLLKHASNVPQCALILRDMFQRAGFPEGVFQTLLISAAQTTPVISDERVKAVSLTGSEAAGISVARACGKHIKKCVLELGGSDPFIVMPSANIEDAIEAAIISRMRNNGQSCIAAKRLILHADIYDVFRKGFLQRLNTLTLGDPTLETTDIGPLVSQSALSEANQQVLMAQKDGATYTQGNQPLPERGFYIQPAILENISPDMRIFKQEIFAPIAMFFRVGSIDEAVMLANDTPFGLSSVLFSNDKHEINQAITDLEAGSTFVNRYASSDIRLPFGGTKRSGYGREMAKEGLREFTNLKTVIIAN